MSLSPAASTVLASLRSSVESTTIEADGTKWGCSYLPNTGKGHAFAGHLSALEGAGLYRRTGNDKFGEVLMAAKVEDKRAASKAAWAALKASRTFNNPLNG